MEKVNKVYQIVHEKILERLEEAIKSGDTAMWRKSWVGGTRNHVTGHQYRGINLLLLDPGEYITFKQIKEIQKKNKEVKLRKGSKSELVIYWLWYKFREDGKVVLDKNGKEQMYAKPMYYRVFNINDVDGLEPKFNIAKKEESIEEAEEIIRTYVERENISFKEIIGGDRAFYTIGKDSVTTPGRNQFSSVGEYYRTVFHELIHSTGDSNRLKRFNLGEEHVFGSQSYSKEELVAEIGSNFLIAHAGLEVEEDLDNSVAYLQGWYENIKADPNLIISASQQAQKACDFVLGVSYEKEDVA